ncbi:dTMP kinase [Thermodesulfovibrio yellowstonii]|uniref:Thymidylate kinase n=1 Tax=Thermodesulfovibrio yellowstonii TaxID=28262 RepID=A0A9W6LKH6_9BACT|nr:dTMP kinase [Thermodesulfovibrio islandicus]GLI54256.1 thymidylate kinase [Thermodesulfovibrio islandicus]
MNKGIFITFEGIEGSGKTTQGKLLAEKLKKEGLKVLYTYEPGDTEAGKHIRKILLNSEIKINPLCELLLYFADRVQHIEEKIKPSIESGFIVICDRFTDSTLVYQGYARGISIDLIKQLNKIVLDEFMPDLTVLLDCPANIGLKRNQKINKKDRFEMENLAFHEKVRQGYLKLVESYKKRFFVLDATESIDKIAEDIYRKVKSILSHGL